MVNNLASDALYRKYEEEKSLLELYGHVNNLTFENWLDTKKSNKKNMKSTINWQTGEPKESGSYLVFIKGEFSNYTTCAMYNGITGWCHWKKEEITAWCKLSDIEPYKEE